MEGRVVYFTFSYESWSAQSWVSWSDSVVEVSGRNMLHLYILKDSSIHYNDRWIYWKPLDKASRGDLTTMQLLVNDGGFYLLQDDEWDPLVELERDGNHLLDEFISIDLGNNGNIYQLGQRHQFKIQIQTLGQSSPISTVPIEILDWILFMATEELDQTSSLRNIRLVCRLWYRLWFQLEGDSKMTAMDKQISISREPSSRPRWENFNYSQKDYSGHVSFRQYCDIVKTYQTVITCVSLTNCYFDEKTRWDAMQLIVGFQTIRQFNIWGWDEAQIIYFLRSTKSWKVLHVILIEDSRHFAKEDHAWEMTGGEQELGEHLCISDIEIYTCCEIFFYEVLGYLKPENVKHFSFGFSGNDASDSIRFNTCIDDTISSFINLRRLLLEGRHDESNLVSYNFFENIARRGPTIEEFDLFMIAYCYAGYSDSFTARLSNLSHCYGITLKLFLGQWSDEEVETTKRRIDQLPLPVGRVYIGGLDD